MRNPSSVGLDDIKEILWSAVQGPSSDRLRASLTVDSIFRTRASTVWISSSSSCVSRIATRSPSRRTHMAT